MSMTLVRNKSARSFSSTKLNEVEKQEVSSFWKIFEKKSRKKREELEKTERQYGDIFDAIEDHFPGAHEGEVMLECVKPIAKKLGLTDDNTLFAQSICPDEINHEEGDIPNLFANHFGEVFHMGGLAGIPFTGKTGFAAFSHHVPDDGHCFILMAPHIGLSDAANLGQYSRDGQAGGAGSACGAAVGALGHCCSGRDCPNMADNIDEDPQMAYIINKINERKESILKGTEGNDNKKQENLVRANYEIANDMLQKIVSLDFGSDTSKLLILTGIQINMPRPFEDYFEPISFEIRSKDGTTINLFDETFSDDAYRMAEERLTMARKGQNKNNRLKVLNWKKRSDM